MIDEDECDPKVEEAYRRGYYHGADDAGLLHYFETHLAVPKCKKWVNRLVAWRNKRLDHRITPPSIDSVYSELECKARGGGYYRGGFSSRAFGKP